MEALAHPDLNEILTHTTVALPGITVTRRYGSCDPFASSPNCALLPPKTC